jgi:hypothetical protein
MPRRFSAQISTAQKGLRRTMERMGAIQYKVTEENGNKIIIMFVLKGDDLVDREYRYICDEFEHPADNYRAAQMALDYLWRIHDDYRVRAEGGDVSLDTIFKGFRVLKSQEILLALPDASNMQPWELLGISRDSNGDDIRKAFHKITKEQHPDVGGDTDHFQRLVAARDEMLEMVE